MFHISFIFLPFIFTILTMTMANPCPCELIANESLSNNPANTVVDSVMNQLVDDETFEDYLDQLPTPSQSETSTDLSSLHPLFRQIKSLETNRKRFKRPSWATVGKRAYYIHNKPPSWAQIG
ncbi:unnamed protein product [Rotaria sp. Silwood1]|nr:unnamed protein product [Rotaria sp. Silwood1]CAF3714851.1 unnamed protein product [Rotaria sp. Silwood1]CAF3766095.1 unnamed protein product [Rotaria sp. Silwood1]CAF4821458.1 unnamed protein product [Rotaria sp. Silwood1]CAF4822678.1 unnamed protein product [Rotaria sp. Silwood1]